MLVVRQLLALLLWTTPALAQEPPAAPPDAPAEPTVDAPEPMPEVPPAPPVAPASGSAYVPTAPVDSVPVPPRRRGAFAPPDPPAEGIPSGAQHVTVFRDDAGFKLQVDGEDFFIKGMNWGYIPIGENYAYDFWSKPDDFITAALHDEMTLMKSMGVNAIRQFAIIPPRWVAWIHENYGIYTMLNPLMGRYGFTLDGVWIPNTDYSDPKLREAIKAEAVDVARMYKDVPGVLMYVLGNENNYGLVWTSYEIENLPDPNASDPAAVWLYTLMGETVDAIKAIDDTHPVGIANGDLGYIDLIKEYIPNLDLMGSNVYRGISSRDLFEVVSAKLDVPFFYTEFGADAFNARDGVEDDLSQAVYLHGQWEEIYEQSYGKGLSGNAIGGFTFQWVDGWWKYKQEENLSVHDNNASWSNAGYDSDYVDGQNNMNEEWFGICAKGNTTEDGRYRSIPRTAYYVLQAAYRLDPYAAGVTLDKVRAHFDAIRPAEMTYRYASIAATERVKALERVTLTNARIDLSMFMTGGGLQNNAGGRPNVDHMESFYLDFAVRPTTNLSADISINLLGNVANNPIDDIFFEKRNRRIVVQGEDGTPITVNAPDPFKLYRASFTWDHPWFTLTGFYRTGHTHWGYEGDFFGVYPEAYYGNNIDIYNGNAPFGFEFAGRKALEGFKFVMGPEVTWGANPRWLAKYARTIKGWTFALLHAEDIAEQGGAQTTRAVPEQLMRQSTVYLAWQGSGVTAEIGGITAGSTKLGATYVEADPIQGSSYLDSGYAIVDNTIDFVDTLGAKARLTYRKGFFGMAVEGAYQGLVADGGGDWTTVLTGWRLKPSGRGNHWHARAGMTFQAGSVQIAPAGLVQVPLEGPLTRIEDGFDPATGLYRPGVIARNVQDDPFAVLDNRETYAAELLLVYDPTPATWMFKWDHIDIEDAKFSGWIDAIYRVQPTSRDSNFGVLDTRVLFAFGDAPPAQDVWEVNMHALFVPRPAVKVRLDLYAGQDQSTGLDPRLVTRFGGTVGLWHRRINWSLTGKVNDWGPFDFHRDFNLTFPLQLITDLSYGAVFPRLAGTRARIGLSGKLRYLDENSPEFDPNNTVSNGWGQEYEVRTYVQINL